MTESNSLSIRLNSKDNVVVARTDIAAGEKIQEEKIVCGKPISFGHKIAASKLKAGEAIIKYGQDRNMRLKQMTMEEQEFAFEHLDAHLMDIFHYNHPIAGGD